MTCDLCRIWSFVVLFQADIFAWALKGNKEKEDEEGLI